jgi:hypothetical protein
MHAQTALLELLLGLVEGNPNADTVLFLASKLEFEKMTSYVALYQCNGAV